MALPPKLKTALEAERLAHLKEIELLKQKIKAIDILLEDKLSNDG